MTQLDVEPNSENLSGIPQAGDVIGGKYTVRGLIGLGGMGAVLEGVHDDLGQAVAIKVLLPRLVSNQDVRARFLREARSAARLRGDHLTRIFDVGALDDGTPFMVMERLEGIALDDELQQVGKMPPGQAVDCVLQVCEALGEAHAAGIVHRDLKPANLFRVTHGGG